MNSFGLNPCLAALEALPVLLAGATTFSFGLGSTVFANSAVCERAASTLTDWGGCGGVASEEAALATGVFVALPTAAVFAADAKVTGVAESLVGVTMASSFEEDPTDVFFSIFFVTVVCSSAPGVEFKVIMASSGVVAGPIDCRFAARRRATTLEAGAAIAAATAGLAVCRSRAELVEIPFLRTATPLASAVGALLKAAARFGCMDLAAAGSAFAALFAVDDVRPAPWDAATLFATLPVFPAIAVDVCRATALFRVADLLEAADLFEVGLPPAETVRLEFVLVASRLLSSVRDEAEAAFFNFGSTACLDEFVFGFGVPDRSSA